MFDVRGI
jgi:hypothetical protein